MKLQSGQWCYWRIDNPMPDRLAVYEGAWEHRRNVGEVTRQTAMKHYRTNKNGGVYHSVKDGNYRWIDIRVAGDTDAFYGDNN